MQVVRDEAPKPSPYAHARCRYVSKVDGKELFIFNTTKQDPDLVISVGGVEYAQDVKFAEEFEASVLQPGDYVFRLLDAVELADLSRHFAKAWWKQNHRSSKVGFKAVLKRYKDRLRLKPVVFQLSEKVR